jgi:hypothetical protein
LESFDNLSKKLFSVILKLMQETVDFVTGKKIKTTKTKQPEAEG